MAHNHHSRMIGALSALLMCWQLPAVAQSSISLEVTISSAESQVVSYSLADLDAMEQVSFRTSTIWTDDEVTFSGVPLQALLEQTDTNVTAVEMTALNDYKVVMPLSEIDGTVPIVATRMDDELMSVRDKGPYWVVFPYDDAPQYQTETVYSTASGN